MKRQHLFEFADQPWFPRYLADAGTAYLATLQARFGLDDLILPLVQRALDVSGRTTIVDLCSGGGGPMLALRDRLELDGDVLLTDLTPNTHAELGVDGVRVHDEPVDATSVPRSLNGLRTVFNALHHFQPDGARAVLQDAMEANEPILVVELSERGIAPLTVGTLFIPLMVAVMMPFVRPFRPGWLALTYLVPVLPLFIAWDGWVSHWRTYSPEELQELVAPLARDGWTWTIQRDRQGPGSITWLLGTPDGSQASG